MERTKERIISLSSRSGSKAKHIRSPAAKESKENNQRRPPLSCRLVCRNGALEAQHEVPTGLIKFDPCFEK